MEVCIMTYKEVVEAARGNMGLCKACPVCDGKACRNTVPGPGAKGSGTVAMRNYDAWQSIRLNMDTLCAGGAVDTTCDLFGQKFVIPVLAGPVGAVKLHYGDKLTDVEYNDILVSACKDAGIAAITGDGTDPNVIVAACKALKAVGGVGIPTVKPWDKDTIAQKMALAVDAGTFAMAMDIDAAGLPFLKNLNPPAGSKTVEEMKEIIDGCKIPFILKGIMTAKGAEKALAAGASAIIVSNHGGRVLDQVPGTAEVLPEIVEAVGGKMKILVDGGIRTGVDVFKAIALGADAVVIARPYVVSVYGGGAEGVAAYTKQLQAELADTMAMCGAHNLSEITRDMVRI